MVLQDDRSLRSKSTLHIPRLELDPSRIVGISGALLLNLGVLGLLLVPASMPPMAHVDRGMTVYEPIDRPEPPPLPPVIEVPVQPAQPQSSAPTVRPVQQPAIAQPTIDLSAAIDDSTLPALPTADMTITSTATDMAPPSGPVAGIALRYLRADAPPYPREQLLAGVEGTVMLKVLVDVDGRPIQVDIQASSGNRKLDEAARRFVLRNWLFEPALKDGHAVQATGIVPIAFNLGR